MLLPQGIAGYNAVLSFHRGWWDIAWVSGDKRLKCFYFYLQRIEPPPVMAALRFMITTFSHM